MSPNPGCTCLFNAAAALLLCHKQSRLGMLSILSAPPSKAHYQRLYLVDTWLRSDHMHHDALPLQISRSPICFLMTSSAWLRPWGISWRRRVLPKPLWRPPQQVSDTLAAEIIKVRQG